MAQLRLVGVSEDGERLVLTDDNGVQHEIVIDERLRAGVNGHLSRLGQLTMALESRISPREIQNRVRSGESAEHVAQSAAVPLERVLRFVGPVLREREHIADQVTPSAVGRHQRADVVAWRPGDQGREPARHRPRRRRLGFRATRRPHLGRHHDVAGRHHRDVGARPAAPSSHPARRGRPPHQRSSRRSDRCACHEHPGLSRHRELPRLRALRCESDRRSAPRDSA